MDRDEFLEKIERINVWQRGGERAPHKPLLLLLALGRILRMEARLASYQQIETRLTDLLKNFGPPRKAWHPEFPFGPPARRRTLGEIPGGDNPVPNCERRSSRT